MIVETDNAGFESDSDSDGTVDGADDADNNPDTNDNQLPVSVVSGETDTGNNFVDAQTGTVSGEVMEDTTGDGVPSADQGLAGAVVSVYLDVDGDGQPDDLDEDDNPDVVQIDTDGDGIPDSDATITTDATGQFSFDLPPGNYLVLETNPPGYSDIGESDGVIDNSIAATVNSGEDTDGLQFIDISSVILPIELVYFTAEANGNNSVLNWQTSTEINNSHFEILRSIDGVNFQQIDEVSGAGTTTETQNYEYVDVNAGNVASTLYYKLRQVDFDGESEPTSVRIVQFETPEMETKVYPNPVQRGQDVQVESKSIENIVVYSIDGRIQARYEFDQESIATISTSGLAPGTYILLINKTINRKIIVE